jgi:hypothetical protein
MKNFYQKFKFKVVKFSNFETPSPNFPAPSTPILLLLNNLKIQHNFRLF